jgi:hypothetical protein
MNQDFKQVKRTAHMDRPVRLGTFGVKTGSGTKSPALDQKAPKVSNLRMKANFTRRRLRK